MKGSVIAILMFTLGILTAHFHIFPEWITGNSHELALFTLYVLIGLIGFEFGHDSMIENIRKVDPPMFLLPLFTIGGTLVVTAGIGLILGQWSTADYLAVGSGMGYYSLSSLLILDMRTSALGVAAATQLAMLAFLTNMSRELVALLGAPLFRKWFGRLAPIAAGGVTSIDVTLPIIVKVSGQQAMVVAVVHGILLELSVPLMVTFFCSI